MEISFYILGFLFSTSLASFYTNLVYRIYLYFYTKERKKFSAKEKWKLIFFKPSRCENCDTEIKPLHLIPIFGYFFANGKCSNCKAKIKKSYFVIEIVFGLLFLLIYGKTKNFILSMSLLALLGHLLLTIYTDIKKYTIDYENIPFIVLFGILANYQLGEEIFLIDRLYIFFGFAISFLLLYFFYKKGIGLGDVIFISFFAMLTGHPYWILFLNTAYISGILFSYIFRDKKKSFLKMQIPMGVYFSISLFLIYLIKIMYPLEW
jgi:leader peptidase (prepilin peptidase) / N-methyltransferase